MRMPESKHFEIQRIAEGVYAALGIPGSPTFSNAGIVDLGNQTLVFDTFEMPEAGKDLRDAARQLTGRPASYIVISHSHSDHWLGNQAFDPQVPVISAHGTLEEMPKDIGWVKELKEDHTDLAASVQEMQEALESETDPDKRRQLSGSLARFGGLLAALPTLELRFPDLTFEGHLVFRGNQRTVEVHTIAPGHTACDSYLVLPEEHIMFMGDLGFFQSQPFMAFCDPEAWQAWLQEMEDSDVEVFVPGHGPLGSRIDLGLQRQYLAAIMDLVARVIEQSRSVADALGETLPEPFDDWVQTGAARWESNIYSMYERLSEQ
jgi:cyclase